jgi:formamidopyrimidine-DNA glycosylase
LPELPEVETVRRTLAPALGMRIVGVRTSGKPLRMNRPVDVRKLRRATKGAVVAELRRRGKYLLVDVANKAAGGRGHTIIVHLGMSGQFMLVDAASPVLAHTHVVFEGSGKRELRFIDPRRFGLVVATGRGLEGSFPSIASLGVDPVVDGVDPELLYAAASKTKRDLKTFLLDQRVITGIGNIYASEALWRAKIRPTLRGHKLSKPRARLLAGAITEVLDKAIKNCGTSLRDFVDGTGQQGENLDYLWVYGRDGEKCRQRGCGGVIRRQVTQGRATFYCPRCQKR